MRIDKFLWFLRFAKTRSAAQSMVGAGHIRLDGRRIDRAAQGIEVGEILVLPLHHGVTVIEVIALPRRRGPPAEARSYYRVLDESPANPIAAEQSAAFDRNSPP
jgi:ribosome-associated heat shock protein Hsp15